MPLVMTPTLPATLDEPQEAGVIAPRLITWGGSVLADCSNDTQACHLGFRLTPHQRGNSPFAVAPGSIPEAATDYRVTHMAHRQTHHDSNARPEQPSRGDV
jgi:hypothetical protein